LFFFSFFEPKFLSLFCFFTVGAALDVSAPGEPTSAQLVLYDLVAFFFELRGTIYFISTVGPGNPNGGCARITELQNTTLSTVPSVIYPNDLLLESKLILL
jgi:hypothetical protein